MKRVKITSDNFVWHVLTEAEAKQVLGKVFVRGRLSVKSYQDRNGNTQVAVNVNASEVNLCGLKGEQSAASNAPAQQAAAPTQEQDDLPF